MKATLPAVIFCLAVLSSGLHQAYAKDSPAQKKPKYTYVRTDLSKPIAGNWDMMYSFPEYAAYYNAMIEVKNANAAYAEADKIIREYNGSMPRNSGGYYNSSAPVRQLTFMVTSAKAEAAALKLLELGTIKQYSNSVQPISPERVYELDQKIATLSKELEENKGELEKMPVVKVLATNKLTMLTKARQAYTNSLDKALITLTIREEGYTDPNQGMY